MVKKLIVTISMTLSLFGQNAYEQHCIQCHRELPMTLQRMFMNYLSVYSGEKNTKAALKHFMRHPRGDTSVMSELFLKNFAVKQPLMISDQALNEAIDIYWETYKVIGKLR
ncbi:MAG: hypothetical protein U9R26_08870 [Campylobacterota bacterium]|nr:hypothetical protein [Campylobacterota bacterium]